MGDIAPFSGVLVPEQNYKEYTVAIEFMPYCHEKIQQCYQPEPTFWENWGKPILFIFVGASVAYISK